MKKKKIIIIDDEKGFTELVKTVLEETGEYEVIEENDGQKGYLTVLREGPALILLDLMMPGADGAEIAEKIKRDEDLKGTPIIFLTAAATEGETQGRTGDIGGHLFISKPVGIKNLIESVRDKVA